jgi:hypothetical protein
VIEAFDDPAEISSELGDRFDLGASAEEQQSNSERHRIY